MKLNLESVPTPCTVHDLQAFRGNLAVLDRVQRATGCRILLALKGFAVTALFPLIRRTLVGTCASSPHEARLGREEFGGEVHVYAPAYSDRDIEELVELGDSIVFNSFAQWEHFKPRVQCAPRSIKCGLRINPRYSEIAVDLYNPCAPYSRLGIPRSAFDETRLDGITGLHFHTHCEQNADALRNTLSAVERSFGRWLPRMDWVNFGGGHHITRPDYDVELLCRLIEHVQATYNVQVYLEPGEAVALNAGVLVASVLDIVDNGMQIAILDTSAAAHMPDVLEMPYRPAVTGAAEPGRHPYTYRLAGLTCLAGDVIGDYSFARPLHVGSKLVFEDMAHYTTVKNTTFNGVRLPSLAIVDSASGDLEVVREFGYGDYRSRLG